MKNALVRAALAVVALSVGAWLVVGYRETRLEAKGDAAIAAIRASIHGGPPPDHPRNALKSLHDAQWLNADQDPRVTEGELNVFLSQRAHAAAIAREVTAAEPDNVRGWFLAFLAESGEARLEARRQVERLDPWAGDTLR
jgi:hypothetical protein